VDISLLEGHLRIHNLQVHSYDNPRPHKKHKKKIRTKGKSKGKDMEVDEEDQEGEGVDRNQDEEEKEKKGGYRKEDNLPQLAVSSMKLLRNPEGQELGLIIGSFG
jgi:hypothetical protein